MTVILMNWEDMTLVASGHAGGGEKGQDIICAGLSALTQALLFTLQDAKKRGRCALKWKIDEDSGDLRIDCRPYSGYYAEIRAYFRVIMKGLNSMAEVYPENIKIGEVWTSGNL